MSEGSRKPDPLVLLAHDGELDDVRTLLCEGGASLAEYRRAPLAAGAGADCALVVATPKRILELGLEPDPRDETVHLVIGEAESKTLRKAMSRMGVDFFVRRPVHPDALRLLLLHVLYRGSEKRRAPRVQVGAAAYYRTHLRKRRTVMLDLSITGCRLLLSEPGVEQGAAITVFVPADRDGRRALKLPGEVIRFSPAPT
ncbi:MAG: PilZ domain-containing protein, partial [Miltoncostaeaceae bacterium]